MFSEFHHQVRGRAHAAQGVHVQDRTAYLRRNGVDALCLADGAGSAALSQHGAQAVVDAGCALLTEHFDEFAMGDDAAGVRQAIIHALTTRLGETAARLDCAIEDLATTFLAVAASADRFVIVHIGDGVVGFVKDGEIRVASAPDNAEFANETTFVTSTGSAAAVRLSRGSLVGVAGFILMSDGTGESLFDQRSRVLAPACAKLISIVATAPTRAVRNPEHKKRLRRILNTRIRSATRDDCSIGILARRV